MRRIVLLLCIAVVNCDVYLSNPRGSNNRAREATATRANGNRLFDSQNNARGGYNYGDKTNQRSSSENDHYRMNYFQSSLAGRSELEIEWTNQHGCGGNEDTAPHKMNCNLVLQFMCQDNINTAAPSDSITIRNGQSTGTQPYTKPPRRDPESETLTNVRTRRSTRSDRGLHESWEWYDSCYRRERNKGLFTADQQLKNNQAGTSSAIFTRQNPNENRRGYECPEERDYYPYWHPTPWTDIAVLAHNATMCKYYQDNSFNKRTYGECVETFATGGGRKHWSTVNNASQCTDKGGQWVDYHNYLELAPTYTTEATCLAQNTAEKTSAGIVYAWGKPYNQKKIVDHETINDACFVKPPVLDCKPAGWSRVNHLGNSLDGVPLNYTWKIPHFPSGNKKRCVFRIRYNISTDDYDPFGTTSDHNQQKENNVIIKPSVIQKNPLVDIGADGQPLQLALNTEQTGRTFQDRSHAFFLEQRPAAITAVSPTATIRNLNVRGKRGNIVQTFPAVEYDFIPKRLVVKEDELIHIQWTGSNSHNNRAPGGDGDTGDAGEGTGGTDRHNFVEIQDPSENFPCTYENSTIHQNMEVVWSSLGIHGSTPEEIRRNNAIQLASGGYYSCEKSSDCQGQSVARKATLQVQLNNAHASFAGMVFKLRKGNYHYMCTRNNNFTNRSQKGHIIVTARNK
uniref:protein DD3-3-like n=1 Tax=Ciona intestinalis TaxID=7719 RepID=UPI00006A69FC|nr:protein DD3-3-like [Ciona intestinalis]|eukprot:XP_002122731.1 protein DD3-3-like [Ciona intestinalis]